MENGSVGFTPICIACSHKANNKSDESIEAQFERKLRECSEAFVSGFKVPRVFKSLPANVKQSALSQTHLCLLLEDGRACRIAYRIDDMIDAEFESSSALSADNVDVPPSVKRSSRTNASSRRFGIPPLNANQSNHRASSNLRASLDQLAINTALNMSNNVSSAGMPADPSGTGTVNGVLRPNDDPNPSTVIATPNPAPPGSTQFSISLSRIVRGSARSRHGPSVVLLTSQPGVQASAAMIPAQDVPEDLIEEAQAVLTGKSRNTIIRELQRTNLDINMAVNNLLGRDEAMNSGEEDHYHQDFASFMDVPVVEETMEFHPTLYIDPNAGEQIGDNPSVREATLSRRADGARVLEAYQRSASTAASQPLPPKKPSGVSQCPLVFSSDVEWCRFGSNEDPGQFKTIAALHSELLLVREEDEGLVQWRYDQRLAYTDAKNPSIHHPRSKILNINDERVAFVQTNVCRAVVGTHSGKVCSFVDESLGPFAIHKLDQPAFQLTHAPHKLVGVLTSCYFSAAMIENDSVSWWGAIPRANRINVMNKAKDRSKAPASQQTNDAATITVNMKVSMNAVRFIQVGAVGYIVKDGVPKIGQLLDTVITTDSTYRFLVRNDIRTAEDILNSAELAIYERRHCQAPAGSSSERKRSTSPSELGAENSSLHAKFAEELFRGNPSRAINYNLPEWYEENWHLADVVFIEDCNSTPLGTVLMVDKNLVLVKIESSLDGQSCDEVPKADTASHAGILSNTRIFRKDDLKPFDKQHSTFVPSFFVKTPKRLNIDFGKPLAMCLDNEALHCVSMNETGSMYMIVDLMQSKISQLFRFPYNLSSDPFRQLASNCLSLSVPYCGDIVLLRDANQCPLQIKPTFAESIQEIDWMRMMPFSSICNIIQPLKLGDPYSPSGYRIITFATMSHSQMMPLVIRSEVEGIVSFIFPESMDQMSDNSRTLDAIVDERIDGNRNLLHAAVAQSFPLGNRRSIPGVSSEVPSKLTKDQKSSECNFAISGQADFASELDEDQLVYGWRPVGYSLHEKEVRGQLLVKCLLQTECLSLRLDKLLTHRDMQGLTPFMYAVRGRSYVAAIDILEKILEISRGRDDKGDFLRKSVYPSSSEPATMDDSPLYMLCCNDTCSYTWTGDDHITQNVYKCYTCNIQGSRCCCSECARVCHRNHDCRLKPTSPTAYCDCWEDCRCKAMIAGDKKSRIILFNMLLKETDLIQRRNSRNEPIPLFVVQTAARQMLEQRQYKGNNRTLLRIRRNAPAPSGRGAHPDTATGVIISDSNTIAPSLFTCTQMSRRGLYRNGNDKELPPPTFCHDVLDVVLNDYSALSSVFCVDDCSITDRFVLTLLTRLPEAAINQLIVHLEGQFERFVQPFVESVARVVIYISMITTNDARCNLPIGLLANFHTRVPVELRGRTKPLASLLDKAREIFCMFPMKSIESVVEIAEMLLSPVKAGSVGSEGSVHLYNDVKAALQILDNALSSTPNSRIFDSVRRPRGRGGPSQSHHDDQETTRAEQLLQRMSEESDLDGDRIVSFIRARRTEWTNSLRQPDGSGSSSESSSEGNGRDDFDDETYNFDAVDEDDCDETDSEGQDDEEYDDDDGRDDDMNGGGGRPSHRPRLLRSGQQGRAIAADEPEDVANEEDMSGSDEDVEYDEEEAVTRGGHGQNGQEESEVSAITPALHESLRRSTGECEDGDTDVDVEEVIAYSCESTDDEEEEGADDEHSPNAAAFGDRPEPVELSARRGASVGEHGSSQDGTPGAPNDLPVGAADASPSTLARRPRTEGRSTAPQHSSPIRLNQPSEQMSNESFSARYVLCRGYAVAVRLVAFVIGATGNNNAIEAFLEDRLAHTWTWMCQLMNSNEISLLQAVRLTSGAAKSGSPTIINPLRSPYLTDLVEVAKKRDSPETSRVRSSRLPGVQPTFLFLKGVQSIWRSNNLTEHDCLPYVTLASCDYIAYIVDAMLCLQLTLDKSTRPLPFSLPWKRKRHPDQSQRRPTVNRRDHFYERSESTTCIGIDAPDPIATRVVEALPLVSRPQILQPDTQKEEMWLNEHLLSLDEMLKEFICPNESAKSTFFRLLNTEFKAMPIGDRSYMRRWRLSLDVFARVFIDTIGQEQLSIYPMMAHFDYVESKFRNDAERLRQFATKEIRFENVERTRVSLIYKLFRCLNVAYLKATGAGSPSSSGPSPLLTQARIRVSFKDEPGEGVGVTRSFYTSVVAELLSDQPLPPLESCQPLSLNARTTPSAAAEGMGRERRLSISPFVTRRSLGRFRDAETGAEVVRSRRSMPCLPESVQDTPPVDAAFSDPAEEVSAMPRVLSVNTAQDRPDTRVANEAIGLIFSTQQNGRPCQREEEPPLFWKPQPDKEFYAPRPAFASPTRINAFRNVGRLMGLCLLNNDILPLPMCRHVFKYILNRELAWHDLAFFDPTIYESMRHLLYQAEWNQTSDISDMGLYWNMDLRDEEGGKTIELIDNGNTVPVNNTNVQGYVRQYMEIRLIKIVEPFLKNMRMGLLDVLPASMISNLTAEQFRLLLNGSDCIDVKTLYNYSTFIDESGEEGNERLDRFKRWFWAVVEGMTAQKRQDLVLFWTGSPTLPSSVAGFQASPSITIRHPDDEHLPTANTCISRLYIPLYSSKRILRQKLLYAIRAKNFGFI